MNRILYLNKILKRISNLTFSRFSTSKVLNNELKAKPTTALDDALKKYKESLYFCEYRDGDLLRMGYTRYKAMQNLDKKKAKLEKQEEAATALPIALRYFTDSQPKNECIDEISNEAVDKISKTTQFPFQQDYIEIKNTDNMQSDNGRNRVINPADEAQLEVKTRLELLNKGEDHLDWMKEYENYREIERDEVNEPAWKINYGTADPKAKISDTPCGGCGAFLHCKDSSIPGYIPSEIFKTSKFQGGTSLKAMTCQRCHFLKRYNMALQVRVSPDDYPKILRTISQRQRALVVLMVDLLDFPCSIWPGITDLIGYQCPIIVVGNKVDLLPSNGKYYLRRIQEVLRNSLNEHGFATTNIKHVALISAKTGYGVEDLISKMFKIWSYKGDVFLVGCTNVGKSSLFNTLLQSDYCKIQAGDLIQRATTSVWPGTTLNLLKFPILRPTGWRLYARNKRLQLKKQLETKERSLETNHLKKGSANIDSLIGHINRTFEHANMEDSDNDVFALKSKYNIINQQKVGIDENNKMYALNKWCYDTPGVVQPDQIIHMLTADELGMLLPNEVIRPRTFSLRPGSSLFIGGIARLDFLESDRNVRFTVFASLNLPINVCKTSDADDFYQEFLGTKVFQIPFGQEDRLKLWPGLHPSREFTLTGLDTRLACCDIVLSNAGWVAVTPSPEQKCVVKAWTPEKRGIYQRDALLENTVWLRGMKVYGTCAYRFKDFDSQEN